MVYLDRFTTGEEQQNRACSPSDDGDTFYCRSTDDPNHVVNCCYYNMCNADVKLTFPPTTATTALIPDSGKGKK